MSEIRRNYKDSLFNKLFGDEANKEYLLSLYNALNDTDHKDKDLLEINTIEGVIYMGMKNDVSCILDNYMQLTEHQSSECPNMPVRGLMYFGKMYDKYIKKNKLNIYSQKLIKIPTPKYYVLYNGNAETPDIRKLRLSDAFINKSEDGTFEWTATMVNINKGHNTKLMKSCRILEEYSLFINRIKEYLGQKHSVENAVQTAVNDCIRDGILSEYLTSHKAEVIGMCITEYDEQETMYAFKEEGRQEGRQGSRLSFFYNTSPIKPVCCTCSLSQYPVLIFSQFFQIFLSECTDRGALSFDIADGHELVCFQPDGTVVRTVEFLTDNPRTECISVQTDHQI